jgi:hypothetical protein
VFTPRAQRQPHVTRPRRLRVVPLHVGPLLVLACVICAAIGPTPASAHNGVGAAFKGRVGGYIVYAYDGYPVASGHLEYRLILLNGVTKNPVYGAHPRITAKPPADEGGGNSQSAPLTTYGNVFYSELPNPYPRHWLVHVAVSGPLRAGTVSFQMHGAAPTLPASSPPVVTVSHSTPWLPIVVAVIAGLLVAAGTGLVVARRRHRQQPGPTPG